jgi:P27 family predicted phage terminase small subunit
MSRKKSTTEKIKIGTVREDRLPVRSVKSSFDGYPDPLEDLEEKEMEIFRRLCDHLRSVQSLFDADTFLLTAAAMNLAQMALILPQLREKGLIQEFENGTRNVSPEYSIFQKANDLFLKHSKHLGLDPRSRQDMLVFLEQGEGDDDDPLAGEMPGFGK